MILYSPEFTLNPAWYVNAEYSSPSESGQCSSHVASGRCHEVTEGVGWGLALTILLVTPIHRTCLVYCELTIGTSSPSTSNNSLLRQDHMGIFTNLFSPKPQEKTSTRKEIISLTGGLKFELEVTGTEQYQAASKPSAEHASLRALVVSKQPNLF